MMVQNFKCWLGSFVNFQGIRTSIAKKPYCFVIFQMGPAPSGSAHVHTYLMSDFVQISTEITCVGSFNWNDILEKT